MGTAPRTSVRDKATIKRFLWAFAAGAILMAVVICATGNVGRFAPNVSEVSPNPSAAIANDTSTGYACYSDRDSVTQLAQKNFFQRNSFVRISATEYVSKSRTVIYDGSFVSLSVIYRSDVCGFTVSHKYVHPTDELRNMPASQLTELVYMRGGYLFDLGPQGGTCDTVLPPQIAIAADDVTNAVVVSCLYEV